ncbi:MAG: RNA polymerase sigma factor [Chloroflexota bacterium]|nr:RNA polymerase sigma factor [Chloroflexota bacterium]
MNTEIARDAALPETVILSERSRLVRLCARLTGEPSAAEDLAQETLYEALRSSRRLRDPDKHAQWLSGIARNVCLRWARRRARESARLVRLLSDDSTVFESDRWAADGFDLEQELERRELVELLDRALALLPPETRDVLVAEYVEGTPHVEQAARSGLTEGAIEKRLQRGRHALRRLLTSELRDEAATYGLIDIGDGGWQETRIWCMECGQHRLFGRFGKDHTELTLRCPDCCDPGTHLVYAVSPNLRDLKAFKPALSRLMLSGRAYFRDAVTSGIRPCLGCGRLLPLQPGLIGPVSSPLATVAAVHVRCPHCDFSSSVPLNMLALALPEAQRFWRENPRMRTLPEAAVEVQGRPAIVTTFESISGSSTLQVVSRRDTCEVLGIHGAPRIDPSKAEATGEAS